MLMALMTTVQVVNSTLTVFLTKLMVTNPVAIIPNAVPPTDCTAVGWFKGGLDMIAGNAVALVFTYWPYMVVLLLLGAVVAIFSKKLKWFLERIGILVGLVFALWLFLQIAATMAGLGCP